MVEGLFQPMHLLVIFFIALLVFGPKKLPELGKTIGKAITEFRRAQSEPAARPFRKRHRAAQGQSACNRSGQA